MCARTRENAGFHETCHLSPIGSSSACDGDTKTKKSRRTLALPERCVDAPRKQRAQQAADRLAASEWQETGLVSTTAAGTEMDAANVRRELRRALALVPGLNPDDWTPRELRHSFVSVLSDAGLPVEEISHLVGHRGTTVTELVYRHQLRPVVQHHRQASLIQLPPDPLRPGPRPAPPPARRTVHGRPTAPALS